MTGTPLEWTGERLVPQAQFGELVHAEHLARYRLAAQLAPGRRVLDAACGEGYGTAMLAAAGASEATGVDLDEATVRHAREQHAPAHFEAADVASLPFPDARFDLVVSFETVEHVPDPERALDELARVLAPGGLLVVSTPNARESMIDNEFHVREFTHDEFAELLRARFPAVRLLYQQNWLTSAVLGEADLGEATGERALDVELLKVQGRPPGRELYTIALCGQDVDVDLREVAVAAGVYEAHWMAHRLHLEEGNAQAHHENLQNLLRAHEEMQRSLSWRITKPLRLLGRLLRRRDS